MHKSSSQNINEGDANVLLNSLASVGGDESWDELARSAKQNKLSFDLSSSYQIYNPDTNCQFTAFPTIWENAGTTGNFTLVYMLVGTREGTESLSVAGGFILYEEEDVDNDGIISTSLLTTSGEIVRTALFNVETSTFHDV